MLLCERRCVDSLVLYVPVTLNGPRVSLSRLEDVGPTSFDNKNYNKPPDFLIRLRRAPTPCRRAANPRLVSKLAVPFASCQ